MPMTAAVSSRWFLALLALFISLPTLPVTAQPVSCPHDGDVNQDSRRSPADALLAFRHFLGLTQLTACAQEHANVVAPATSPITPADALCIFQAFLGLPSCFDRLVLVPQPCSCVGRAG